MGVGLGGVVFDFGQANESRTFVSVYALDDALVAERGVEVGPGYGLPAAVASISSCQSRGIDAGPVGEDSG